MRSGFGALAAASVERAAEADQIMRILCDVVLEARLAQRPGGELRVERHRADGLVGRGVALQAAVEKREAGAVIAGYSFTTTLFEAVPVGS